ncbi:hypothetical protein B0J13DRAFT_190749 [Dactylonectria estremocensis]|uniref:Uncharacterized protein n=1 Tax=Dactylonectria estremocensis TaxID=1079267 RepID=A0A9P9JBM3_9HYPO|nr:hypothetical protein B0J13DRAFT_190749 [Dactylonectria estremocensis]
MMRRETRCEPHWEVRNIRNLRCDAMRWPGLGGRRVGRTNITSHARRRASLQILTSLRQAGARVYASRCASTPLPSWSLYHICCPDRRHILLFLPPSRCYPIPPIPAVTLSLPFIKLAMLTEISLPPLIPRRPLTPEPQDPDPPPTPPGGPRVPPPQPNPPPSPPHTFSLRLCAVGWPLTDDPPPRPPTCVPSFELPGPAWALFLPPGPSPRLRP